MDESEGSAAGVLVTGNGAAAAAPDVAVLDLGAEARAATAGGALDAVSQAVSAMRAALLGAGVAERDLATAALSLSPYYDAHPVVAGYQAALALKVRSRSVEQVGALVVAAASAAGDAARVRGISFEHSDPHALAAAARALALADARAKAEQLAELAGRALGEPLSVSARPRSAQQGAGALDGGGVALRVVLRRSLLTVRWSFA